MVSCCPKISWLGLQILLLCCCCSSPIAWCCSHIAARVGCCSLIAALVLCVSQNTTQPGWETDHQPAPPCAMRRELGTAAAYQHSGSGVFDAHPKPCSSHTATGGTHTQHTITTLTDLVACVSCFVAPSRLPLCCHTV